MNETWTKTLINEVLLYAGFGVTILWGISHIIPVKSVVGGFESVSPDNKRIITMEWIAEGLALCFVGALVLSVTVLAGFQPRGSRVVYIASAAMLLVMAVLTAFTGARTAIVPIKICPAVKTAVAILFFLGASL